MMTRNLEKKRYAEALDSFKGCTNKTSALLLKLHCALGKEQTRIKLVCLEIVFGTVR